MTDRNLFPHLLTPAELAELRQDMHTAAEWMRSELRRRRIDREREHRNRPGLAVKTGTAAGTRRISKVK